MSAPAKAARPRNNAHQSHQDPPDPPADRPLEERVDVRLAALAAEAECAELAEGAGDPEIAADTVRQLMAHQLAAGHGLAMGLTGRARRLVRDCAAETGTEETGRRSLELLRFVAGTARMMERCRAAAIALDRIGYPEPPEGPDDDGPHRCDHPHHYAWRLANERKGERRRVLDWLAQGKKPSEMPGVEDWPPYHNPDPDIEKLDERLATAPRHAAPGLNRGRLKNGNPVGDYLAAPRCGARTRAGACCRQPAMPNGRCRFHGGKSTGPRTAEGLRRARTARLSHGFRTAEIIDLRAAAARVGRNLKALTGVAKEGFTTSAFAEASANRKSQRSRSDTKNPPLPLGERGQGVRGLARGSALPSQSLEAGSPTASADLPTQRFLARLRAETPHPCPSPPRGEGIFSSAGHSGNKNRTGRPAGHGVDRSNRTFRWGPARRLHRAAG